MYKIKKAGYILIESDPFDSIQKTTQITSQSRLWRTWRAVVIPGTGFYCFFMNGRILPAEDERLKEIPVHRNCNCYVEIVTAILVGTATEAGENGIDLYIALHGELPSNYLTQAEAKEQGWKKLRGNLAEALPGRIIGGDIYSNWDHRLPTALGRIWYEADFDYSGGYRNDKRVLYSNDGLIFATYDHYMTFYEISVR